MLDQSHLQAQTKAIVGDSRPPRSRVPSFYIRQMTDAKLLIPAEQIKLLDCVGQGSHDNKYSSI